MHRLLWLTENYPPDRGGMAVSCDRIVRGLRRAGVEVDVVYLDRREPDGAHTINTAWNRVRSDAPRATAVVAFGGMLPMLAAPAFAAWLDRPLITLIRGNELDAGLFDPRRRPVLEDALRRAEAVCTVTSEHAEKIAAMFDVEATVIPNGIDFDLWQATEGDRKRAAGLAARDARTLGFFGHLKAKKGVPFFLEALRKSGQEFHLIVVGETTLSFDGFTHTRVDAVDRFALIPYYLASDFVVIPSHYDGFPNVLLESAALGVPVIASRTGGMRDFGEGLLFEAGDLHSCRAAIDRAAAMSADEVQAMGARALRLAHERYDAGEETRRYLSLFDALASRGGALRFSR